MFAEACIQLGNCRVSYRYTGPKHSEYPPNEMLTPSNVSWYIKILLYLKEKGELQNIIGNLADFDPRQVPVTPSSEYMPTDVMPTGSSALSFDQIREQSLYRLYAAKALLCLAQCMGREVYKGLS